jgi:GTP-binding protein
VEELASYSPLLLQRPQLVAGNKMDVADAEYVEEARAAAASRKWDFFPISAVTGEGVSDLVWRIAEMVEAARSEEGPEIPEERTLYTFDPVRERGYRVVREEEGFFVLGERVEQLVRALDISNPQALTYVQGRLKRMGVEDELARLGAQEGDAVIIGDFVFDFLPEQ